MRKASTPRTNSPMAKGISMAIPMSMVNWWGEVYKVKGAGGGVHLVSNVFHGEDEADHEATWKEQ